MDQPQHDNGHEHNEEVVDTTSHQGQESENIDQESAPQQADAIPISVFSTSDLSVQPVEDAPEVMPAPAASDELADVANELAAMSTEPETPSVDEGLPGQGEPNQDVSPPLSMGTDPMEQIKADEASANAANMTQENNFPSGEQANEMDTTETPAENLVTSPIQASPVSDVGQEQISSEPMSEAPAPLAEEPSSNSDAVNMANVALLEREPTRNPGDLINDVIAPTAVAAAVAEGTSGENAITGTPEAASVTSAQEAAAVTTKPPKQKSSTGKLILIVIIVVLLFGGAAVAAYMIQSKKDKDNKASMNKQTSSTKTDSKLNAISDLPTATPVTTTTTPAPGETVTAKALDDYKVACGGGMVTNASDFKGAGPHPVVFFEKGSDNKYAMSIVAFKDKTWAADATKVSSGQLAVCVSEKIATEKKIKTCSITDPATKVTSNVDYFSASYAVDVYNAKTGSKINSYESPSIVTECPTTAIYDKANPKIVAKYDLVSVETLIKDVVTKTL
jgi:hypothetical protein